MKKKTGKYILLGIVGIIIVLVAVNWGDIKLLVNMMSRSSSDDEQITEEELADLKNPLSDIVKEENIESPSVDENTEDKKDDSSIENIDSKDKAIEKNNEDLYVEILAKYNSRFEALQTNFEGQLDNMVKEGYQEYKNGDMSKIKLANKYISMSKALEKESDANFNQVLKEMEQELKDNGFDTSITKDVDSYYKNYKEKKKMDILAKGSKVK